MQPRQWAPNRRAAYPTTPLSPRSQLKAFRGAARTIQSYMRQRQWRRMAAQLRRSREFRSLSGPTLRLVSAPDGRLTAAIGLQQGETWKCNWYTGVALGCLSPRSRLRLECVGLIESTWFKRSVIAAIFANW